MLRSRGLFILFLLFCSCSVIAQKRSIKSPPFSDEIYKDIREFTIINYDSIANLQQQGLILVKFRLTKQGMQDIFISKGAPLAFLIKLNDGLLRLNEKWINKFSSSSTDQMYVLPITYDFRNFVKPTTIQEVFAVLPDMTKPVKGVPLPESLHLYDLDAMKVDYGIPCILLPVLIFRYHIVDVYQ